MLRRTFGKRQRTPSWDEMPLQSEKRPKVIVLVRDFTLSPKSRGDVYVAISDSTVINILPFCGGLPDFTLDCFEAN